MRWKHPCYVSCSYNVTLSMLIVLSLPNFLFFELSSAEKITELESQQSSESVLQ